MVRASRYPINFGKGLWKGNLERVYFWKEKLSYSKVKIDSPSFVALFHKTTEKRKVGLKSTAKKTQLARVQTQHRLNSSGSGQGICGPLIDIGGYQGGTIHFPFGPGVF